MNLKKQKPTKKWWVMLIKDRPLSMWIRLPLYIVGVIAGIFLLQHLLPSLLLYFSSLQNNLVFQSALAILLLTFPLVTINWFIKNLDISRQLKDSSKQLEYSLQQQNETLFSNLLQLLFKENDIIANSVGLKGLVKLKQEEKIDSERIDLITSSGLKIKKASLQGANLLMANLQRANLVGADLIVANFQEVNLIGANLQGAKLQMTYLLGAKLLGANLQEANLQGADLTGTNLLGANLQGADLQGANLEKAKLQGVNLQRTNLQGAELEHSFYDEKTLFPDGFDPDEHKMTKVE